MNRYAQFFGQPGHRLGNGVNAAARVPDAATQLHVGDDVERGRGQIRTAADVGGKSPQKLPQFRRLHVAFNRFLHGAQAVNLKPVGDGHAQKAAPGGRPIVDEDGASDAVNLLRVAQIFLIASHILRGDLANLGGHLLWIFFGVEDGAVGVKVAGERIDRFQRQVIFQAAPSAGEQLFKHVPHGDHRRANVPAEAIGLDLAHLAAHLRVLFVNGYALPGGGQPDGCAESANTCANNENLVHR